MVWLQGQFFVWRNVSIRDMFLPTLDHTTALPTDTSFSPCVKFLSDMECTKSTSKSSSQSLRIVAVFLELALQYALSISY